MNNPLNVVDLFAGAGGMSSGLEKAGFQVLLANEFEKPYSQTYQANHPKAKVICGDIKKIDFKKELKSLGNPHVHVVCGGPPCQGFSTVGKKSLHDPRNSLFEEFLRCVKELTPDVVFFENVSGFKKMYGGAIYQVLLQRLQQLEYQVFTDVVDASDYGVPQVRERTFVIGYRKGLRFTPPQKTTADPKKKLSLMDAISDLAPITAYQQDFGYNSSKPNAYQKSLRGNVALPTLHLSAKHGEKMQEILQLIPPNGSVKDLPKRLQPKSAFGNTYARLNPDTPCPTITRNFGTPSSSRCVHPFEPRALSAREAARIQGFPDKYQFCGNKGQIHVQLGNAVPPRLAEVFGKAIAAMLKRMG